MISSPCTFRTNASKCCRMSVLSHSRTPRPGNKLKSTLPTVGHERDLAIWPTRKLMRFLVGQIAKSRSCPTVGSVDFNLFPGLGVLECDNTDIRQHLLAFVLNVHGDEIMASAADRERVGEVRRLKIGNEKDNRATRYDFV